MAGKVKPIPDGYHAVTPYLIMQDAAVALDFYQKAFGATVVGRMPGPGGKMMHAEVRIGDSFIMLADEIPEMNAKSPRSYGGSPTSFYIYVEDCDAVFNQAIAAGAKVVRPLADQFYGDRNGMVEDPSGHSWAIATHKEDVTPEEMRRRMSARTGASGA